MFFLAITGQNLLAETNCGVISFTSNPDPVTGATNWIGASFCGLVGGKDYSFSKASTVTGLGAPGPGFTWQDSVDLDVYWFPETGTGFGGAIFNYHAPGTGTVNIYAPVNDTAQFFILHGAGTYIPATSFAAPLKGAMALIQKPTVKSASRIPNTGRVNPLKPPAVAAPSAVVGVPTKPKPFRTIDWQTILKKRTTAAIKPPEPSLAEAFRRRAMFIAANQNKGAAHHVLKRRTPNPGENGFSVAFGQ